MLFFNDITLSEYNYFLSNKLISVELSPRLKIMYTDKVLQLKKKFNK